MKALTNIGIYPTDKVEVPQTIQQVLNDVLQILLKYVSLETVYCFGFESKCHAMHNMVIEGNRQNHQQWQINLLLIGKNIPSNSTANLTDIVYQQSKREIGLILLCYSHKEIAKSNNEHKHLFAKIIRSGWLVYGKSRELALLKLAQLPDLDYKGIITYTKSRLNFAESLLKNVSSFFDQPLMAAYILRIFLEQLCLGTLYSFIHYHPKQFYIQYLLLLCKSCCDLPEDTFIDRFLLQKRFKNLLKPSISDLRFRSSNIFSQEDIKAFYSFCVELSDRLVPVIEEQLQTLNSKHHEK